MTFGTNVESPAHRRGQSVAYRYVTTALRIVSKSVRRGQAKFEKYTALGPVQPRNYDVQAGADYN